MCVDIQEQTQGASIRNRLEIKCEVSVETRAVGFAHTVRPSSFNIAPPRPPPPIIASQLAMGVLFRLGVEDATEVSWNRGGASLGQQLGAGSILFDKALWEMWFGGRGGVAFTAASALTPFRESIAT